MAHNFKPELFPGPRLKIERSKKHRKELIEILEDYGSRLETKWIDVEGDPSRARLNFSEPSPPEIPLIIGDVVHNLRAALDLLVNDVAQKRGFNIDTARLQFPYATNEARYRKVVSDDFMQVGQDLHDTILSLRVYEGGDALLCGLHNLDIRDKHRYVMPLLACAWGRSIAFYLEKEFAPLGHKFTFVSFDGETPFFEQPSLDVEGSVVLKSGLRAESFEPYCAKQAPTALFPNGMPFAGKHVIETLDKLIEAAENVIETFTKRLF